ncbi:hypothetical protein COD21_31865 [Bacillus cereus]|uniref:helix-turn-helix domain-containing protein n=1 Tax=Bacillus cereus TaxID=1396 RepID=UPI000BFE0691|nr:helix-turn-helix transcriptional regulator [Bacillus cereus]PGT97816.1 hypothetical protein COD21_31865 [Bacillus cereus]
MKLGNRLKQFRLYKRMSQKELSRDVCSQAFLSKIENNLELPNAQILYYLCKKMDVMIEDLFAEQIDINQQKIFFRKHIEDLIRSRKYKEAEKELKSDFSNYSYSNDYDFKFYHYYIGICSYHLNKCIMEAEKNFDLAYKQTGPTSHLKITPLNLLITNALATMKIHRNKIKDGVYLLEKCYSQISYMPIHNHSDLFSKIFYNLSKCYCLEKKYDLAIKIANEGIDWTKRFSSTYYLSELFYQKGVAYIGLNQKNNAKETFTLALSISKAHANKAYSKIIAGSVAKFF